METKNAKVVYKHIYFAEFGANKRQKKLPEECKMLPRTQDALNKKKKTERKALVLKTSP